MFKTLCNFTPSNKQIMKAIVGILSATIVMHTDNLVVALIFGTISFYALYRTVKEN